jgi:hypothetical protein
MTRGFHQAFSPNLAPSDFYLFGKLKNVMKRYAFGNENKLSLGIMNEVSKISREELEAVFDKQLLRLDRCININGEYVDQTDSIDFIKILQRCPGSFMLNFSGKPYIISSMC